MNPISPNLICGGYMFKNASSSLLMTTIIRCVPRYVVVMIPCKVSYIYNGSLAVLQKRLLHRFFSRYAIRLVVQSGERHYKIESSCYLPSTERYNLRRHLSLEMDCAPGFQREKNFLWPI